MNTTVLLGELKRRDINLTLDGNLLRYDARPGVLTPELAEEVRAHKDELLALLSQADAALEWETIQEEPEPSRRSPVEIAAPPGYLPGDVAIHEGARQLKDQGWMPLWAEALGEPILLALNEAAARKAPQVYPVYTVEEMRSLAGLAPDELQVVHQAKKLFGGKIRVAQTPAGC